MILLFAAHLLIRFAPMRLWRSSLGRQRSTGPACVDIAWPSVRAVTRAVNRAAVISPVAMVCLPRAMTTQWMLGRRGFAPRLVFGVAPPAAAGSVYALHAWVEVQGRIVIGDHGECGYRAAFALQQLMPSPKV